MFRLSLITILMAAVMLACSTEDKTTRKVSYESFENYPEYSGKDLGAIVSEGHTSFKLFAPEAEQVKVNLYQSGHNGELMESHAMQAAENGTWSLMLHEELHGVYYTFQTKYAGSWNEEAVDPYAKSAGVNGLRGMILDMKQTDPEGWSEDKRPALADFSDIILYELHVRDISSHPSSGIEAKGKFMGLVESGSKSPDGLSTGIDHIADLGVTHVHILPAFDYRSVDESGNLDAQFNWGYDPVNYNMPEGSYSSNPADGEARVREFKAMVKGFHDRGIRVIMDVVYNHTGPSQNSSFNHLVPDYYYRQWEDGKWSDASACGNETASDRYMFRKYIVESVAYWANEYHVDGFRFDLMGIHDIETMNAVTDTLAKIDPSLFVYGEGWTAADSPLPEPNRALKAHAKQMPRVAVFSDDMRDGIKGHWSNYKEKGFVSGKSGLEESVKFGVVGAIDHPEIDYSKVNYSQEAYANNPAQVINYVSCHDNHTLMDKLHESNPGADHGELMAMGRLANTIVLTSQGVPFLHAGVEMGRTKQGVENSYNAPDSINQIRWEWKKENLDLYEYYKGLIALRKSHPAFTMGETGLIQKGLKFAEINKDNVVAYTLDGELAGDTWNEVFCAFNGNGKSVNIQLPEGKWRVVCDGKIVNPDGVKAMRDQSGVLNAAPRSAYILYKL